MRTGMIPRVLRESPLLTAAVAALALGGVGVSARAALTAFAYGTGNARAVTLPATGIEGDDRFPGAALAYAETPDLPREASATGYYDIPAHLAATAPASFSAPADLGVTPAPSLAFRGRSGVDSMRAAQCLATAIYYEAASESDDGQRAVAQVILNRVRHPAFPNSVCGVVYQGHERAPAASSASPVTARWRARPPLPDTPARSGSRMRRWPAASMRRSATRPIITPSASGRSGAKAW